MGAMPGGGGGGVFCKTNIEIHFISLQIEGAQIVFGVVD